MFIYNLMLVYFCCSFGYSKDVPITWLSSPRASLPCVVPDADRVVTRRPPPPLNSDDLPRPRQPYLWRKGGEELKRVLSNGTLEVSRKKDGSTEGVYQCAVRHSAGLVLGYPVNLKFAYLDKYFSVNPENATVWEGQSHVLTCDISSGPNASVSWQKDGEPLPESDRHYMLKNQLLILDVTQEDGGIYRCKATNSEANRTRVSNGGRLQVEPSSSARSPAFLPIQHTDNITATEGETVTLACPVTGNPKPTLLWEFTAPGERTAELGHVDEVLMVQDFDMTQQGIYTCTIEENKSMFKTFNISLSVPARITLPPTSKAAFQASTVRFNCTAVGNPTPTITWYKNGQPLELTGRTMVLPSAQGKRMELLIRSVTSDDAGVYQCFANNGHSVASAWAVFNVTGNTEPAPSGVMCWPTDADHVLVRWPMVNNSMAYTVEISNPDGQVLPSQPLKTTELTHTLDTLTPYKFQVRAYIQQSKSNKNVKASDMSEGVTCQGQGIPIRLSRINDGVYVSWRHFPSKKVGVKQWVLQYKTGEETEDHNITLGPEVSNYTIPAPSSEDLQVRLLGTRQLPWLHQNLTLVPWRSTTNDGEEPGGVTGKIDNVEVSDVGPTKFTVQWRCEEAETSDDDYIYSICTRKLDDKNEKCMESHDKWASVEDLTPSTEYIVRVRALISSQPDLVTEFTQPLYVSTQSLGQEPIKDLTYKVVNGSTLRVSWHSGVDKYRVYYNDKLVLPIHTWSSVDTVGNTVLIHDVDTSKELYVIVSGYDPVGYSPVLHIPMHVPGAKELDYTFTSKGLTVTWENREPRVVRFSQNLTQPLEQWTTIYVTGDIVHINSLDPTLLTYLEVVAPDQSSSQMFTLPPRQSPDTSIHPSSEPISDLTYKVVNGTALKVSWTGLMDRYTLFYNTEMKLPIEQWHSVDTTENTALITNVNRSRELYVVVLGYNPSGHSPVLHIPVHVPKTELNYTFTSSGLTVTWQDRKVRLVRYSQNLTLPQDLWTSVNVTDDIVHISGLNPSRFTYIDVSSPGEEASQVVTVPPRQQDNTSVYHSSEPIMDLTYKVVNSSTLRVSWTSPMDKYTVYYNSALTLPVHHWPSVDTRENTVLLTNVNTSKELYVMVLGYNPVGYSFFLHIPVKVPEANELEYTFTSTGLQVTWRQQEWLRVWYSQNLTQPPDHWASANGTGESITILDLNPSLPTYVVVTAPHQSARVLTVPPRSADNPLVTPSSESIKDLMYKVINGSTIRVSWNSVMDKHTVYYNSDQKLPVNQWPSVETIGTTVLITNVNTSKELYVTVRGYEPDGYSSILHIPANVHEALAYEFTRSGLKVTWRNRQVRVVMYSQNLTQPLERWTVVNVTDNCVHITGLDPLLRTFVVVQAPGQAANQVLTVPPRPPDNSSVYLSVGIGCAVLILCVLLAAAVCAWRRSKRSRPPARSRRRSISPSDGNEEEMAEMKNAGGHLANGGTSKDAGEPLLNGHVHITENPIPLKTPNGRMRRGHHYEPTFDMSRCEEPDTTLETTLNSTSSAAFNLLDTSRGPEYDLSRSSQNLSTNNSFNKLPDDNMNSELTRSTDFQLDNSKILPTLQPNG